MREDLAFSKKSALIGLMMVFTSSLWSQGTQIAPNQPIPIESFLSLVGKISTSHPMLISHGFILKERKMVRGPNDNMILSYRYRLNHSHNPQTNLYEFDSFDVTDSLFYFQYSTSSLANFQHYQAALLKEFQRQQAAFNANAGAGLSARIEGADSSSYRFVITTLPMHYEKMSERKPMETIYRIETGKEFYEDTPNYLIKVFLSAMTSVSDRP